MKNMVKIYIPSSLKNLSVIRAMVKAYLEVQRVENEDVLKIVSIVDELTTNSVEHGYAYSIGEIVVELQKDGDMMSIVVEDYGNGFNENGKSKEEGGMGLILAKSMSDSLCVEKKLKGTRIKVLKRVKEVVNL